MSISTNTLPKIYPVYNDNLIFTAKENTATADFKYKFLFYFNGSLIDTFDYFADPITFDASINLSPIFQTRFTSTVYIPTGATLFEFIPNSIMSYYIITNCYDATNTFVSTNTSATNYLFNGCFNTQDNFNMGDFIFHNNATSNFLTNWHTNREITINDYASINSIIGNYSTYSSNFGGVNITRYQKDNSISTYTDLNFDNSTKGILNIDDIERISGR